MAAVRLVASSFSLICNKLSFEELADKLLAPELTVAALWFNVLAACLRAVN